MQSIGVIIKPIITEKSMSNVSLGWYTFSVAKRATKKQIAKEVERLFKVQVRGVRTEIVKGKTRRVNQRRVTVKKASWKKAFVRLKEGEKIDLFEVQPKEKV